LSHTSDMMARPGGASESITTPPRPKQRYARFPTIQHEGGATRPRHTYSLPEI
jgi:hypothetical protein